MIVFGFNRSRRLRRAATVESDVELVLSREGLEYRHPQDTVAIDWSEIIDPLDAASHIRRRDGGASLLLIRKDAGQVSRRSLRALRRAHRLGILAPTRVAEGVHIPLRFLDANAPETIRNEARSCWKANAEAYSSGA